MERVLSNKVNYLINHGYDIYIITTDQKKRPVFFDFSDKVKFIDLGINYENNSKYNILKKILLQYKKLKKHRKLLENTLKEISPDITISMFGMEIVFLYKLTNGGKKIAEFHFSKKYKIIENKNLLVQIFQKLRLKKWEKLIVRYDKFVTLTKKDLFNWGYPPNGTYIPNAIPEKMIKNGKELKTQKTISAAGRLTYQKGFDLLIKAWHLVHKIHPDWKLEIYGTGDDADELISLIQFYGLDNVVSLKGNVIDLQFHLQKSDFFIMSSRYEGLPMVLLEAMAAGLPCISFDCDCGPSDIITNGINGLLVNNGDIDGLASAINKMIENPLLIQKMKQSLPEKLKFFSEEYIMDKWISLFKSSIDG